MNRFLNALPGTEVLSFTRIFSGVTVASERQLRVARHFSAGWTLNRGLRPVGTLGKGGRHSPGSDRPRGVHVFLPSGRCSGARRPGDCIKRRGTALPEGKERYASERRCNERQK